MKPRAQVADSIGFTYSIASHKPNGSPANLTPALAQRAGYYRRRCRIWDARFNLSRAVCVVSLLAALAGVAVVSISSATMPLAAFGCIIASVFLAGAGLVSCWLCEALQASNWNKYRALFPARKDAE